MQALIENIAKALVDSPGEVSVTPTDADGGKVFELRVAPVDLGRVIGRQGRTARALRSILAAASSKQNRRATLEIIE